MSLQKKVNYLFLTVVIAFFISCGEKDLSVEAFENNLPQVTPREMNSFQSVGDTLFFAHLGYKTVPLEEGFLLYDRSQPMLLHLNVKGNLLKQVSKEGRGPGEVLDVASVTKTPNGEILLYDQGKKTVAVFGQDLKLESQFLPEPFEGNSMRAIYPAEGGGQYMTWHSSYAYLRDESKQPKSYLVPYNADTESYNNPIKLQDRRFARYIIDGKLRGGSEVAFSPNQLMVYHPGEQALYTYWTGSREIANVSASLDTLNTIPVELPSQEIGAEELDSLRERSGGGDHWHTLRELLPEMKTPVEKMKVDHLNRFWLKVNYTGDNEKWVIMNREGAFHKMVLLPKGSMLTHISNKHLGVRLDDITFALFEPVE